MFGDLLGELLSIPARVASLPFRAANVLMNEDPKDNPLDELADGTKEVVKKVLDGE